MKKKIKELEKEITEFEEQGLNTESLKKGLQILKKDYHSNLSDWDKVQIARDPHRPSSLEYINTIFDDFIELHGDRYYGDDKAIVGGIALLNDMPVTVIGVQKGSEASENIERNFGMPHPEGYRKAMRLMEQANKFKRPIVTFVNTPGAYPGFGAEERGQGQAIASNLVGMMKLEVPVISIIIGEGGSGGALALAVANKVWMLENSIYSILSPEGFASILYKDASKASEVVTTMKITSEALFEMGIIDYIISERHGINDNFNLVCSDIKNKLVKELSEMKKNKGSILMKQRYDRFRNYR
ncbi:acetyl-CoA carboxylase carboxyl transferase subunit alpha [Bacilli bacterium PM5-3]|nr:acetyl-CoA carboxylase carboxyl transferase subunit alpha [Bacilli bacterium PM5-3]MDH6602905.1 acetyl-CoA carboxylase carboxyl transferase subunit alpha [Bacilli bacterium PM5-9]